MRAALLLAVALTGCVQGDRAILITEPATGIGEPNPFAGCMTIEADQVSLDSATPQVVVDVQDVCGINWEGGITLQIDDPLAAFVITQGGEDLQGVFAEPDPYGATALEVGLAIQEPGVYEGQLALVYEGHTLDAVQLYAELEVEQ